MVAVNDQILLRRPFNFTRKQGLFKTVKGTGTVDVSIPVQTGSLNVKVWLSGSRHPRLDLRDRLDANARRRDAAFCISSTRAATSPRESNSRSSSPSGQGARVLPSLRGSVEIAYNPHPSGRSAAW